MTRWLRRLRCLMRRRRLEEDLAEELSFHRALKEQELRERGASEAEAARAGRRALGNTTLARDRARDVWMWPWAQDLEQDIRLAARRLIVAKRFTFTAVVVFSLGIGASMTVFTMVNALLFRPLPFDRPDQLIVAGARDASGRDILPSYPDFQDWRARSRSFAGLFGEISTTMNLSGEERPAERLQGSYISFDAFRIIGREPALGRGFRPDDEQPGAAPVAILSHKVWKNRYGGDSAIVGRVVRVNDVPSTIVGVMPVGFEFPMVSEIWQPLTLFTGVATATRAGQPRSATPMVFGRLKDGISIRQAEADLALVAAQIAKDHPQTNTGTTPTVRSLTDLFQGGFRPMAGALMGAVTFILLIACANLANLFLARGFVRAREFTIQASLGATRWRLVRQQLVESFVIGAAGAVGGLILSVYGVALVASAFTDPSGPITPAWVEWSRDVRVYTFLVSVTIAAILLSGATPAFHASCDARNEALRSGARGPAAGRHAGPWAGVLVASQVALTVVLLTGAGLMLRSFLAVSRAGLVVDTSGLVTMRLAVANQKYASREQRIQFFEQLDERLTQLPGVSSVTVASDIPLMARNVDALTSREVEFDGARARPGETKPTVAHVYAGPRYFETLGVPLLQGRGLTVTDGLPGQTGAIVNQRFSSMFFGGQDPIGERIRLSSANAASMPSDWLTIVGVVPTVPETVFAAEHRPVVYLPVQAEPQPHRFAAIIARAVPAATIVPAIRDAVRSVDADLPVYFVQTMDDVMSVGLLGHRVVGGLLAVLAAIALTLASVGLYAVTVQSVIHRTPEIGIRMALGAQAPQVIGLFARQASLQIGIGLVLGLAGAWVADVSLRSLFVGTVAGDPATFAGVAGLLSVVALTAWLLPVRRALRLDPVQALRAE